jgi:hypothetical protein
MKSNILFTLAASLLLFSCEKTVTLDIEESTANLVIEAQVTDLADHNYVKISRTNAFYDTGETPRVENATVTVEDSDGNIFTFSHDADSAGFYFPETPFAGEIGKSYKLRVLVDGIEYTAQDELVRLVPIEKLEYRINPDEQNDPEVPGRFYELLLSVVEPKDTKDYYLFKSYRNDTITYQNETDIYYSDDELIGEKLDGIPMPVYYSKGDLARVEVFSLSRDAFVFYRDLQKLLNNDGGLFGTPPANPRTNISNGALGFFQVSAVQMGELVIE